jgi:branched-chain amino acid transport system substrate-binding protein
MGIRAQHNPYLFHTRAGYDDEMNKIVDHVARLGYLRIALVYLSDVGPANLAAMNAALAANKLNAVAVVGIDRNAEDFSAQVQQLLEAQPQLVVFISNAKPIVRIVKGMREKGYGGQFATSSFSGSRVVTDLEKHAPGLIMIQVLPQPHRNHLRFHQSFHADLQAAAPGVKPNYTMLEGYIAARVLIAGLERAGPGITRARLAAALSSLPEQNFGGYRVRFGPDNHHGSRYVDLGVVTSSGHLRF